MSKAITMPSQPKGRSRLLANMARCLDILSARLVALETRATQTDDEAAAIAAVNAGILATDGGANG